MIFTPFDLSAAITLLFLSLSSSRLPIPSRGEREKTKGRRRRRGGRKWAKREGKPREARMTASYTSPLVITVRRFTAGRLLYSKDPRGRGKDTIPRQNFPAKRRKAFSVAQFARRVCSRFIGRVNLSDRRTRRARCRQWRTDPSSSPTLLKTTPLAPKYPAGDTAYRGLINEPKSSWLIL